MTAPLPSPMLSHRQQALEARFGLRVAGALGDASVGHDVQERLRVARQQALERARSLQRLQVARAAVSVQSAGPVAVLGATPWWLRLASFAPLMVLALGLLLIDHLDAEERIRAAAEIDAVLLADELPPQAYSDPGFAEYLKQATP